MNEPRRSRLVKMLPLLLLPLLEYGGGPSGPEAAQRYRLVASASGGGCRLGATQENRDGYTEEVIP